MRLTILFLLLTTSICFGQTSYDKYDNLISEANSLKKNGYYKKAINRYKEALAILTPNSSRSFFMTAECALEIGNKELADEWIRKGVSVGGAQMKYLLSYNGFTKIKDHDFYQKIISDYNFLRQAYFSTIENVDTYLEIEKLTARDQFVRKMHYYLEGYSEQDVSNAGSNLKKAKLSNDTIAENKYQKIITCQPEEENLNSTFKLMHKIDSLNLVRLMEITKEHGWQKRAFFILWHQRGTYGKDNYVWNYFKPLIDKEIEEGKLSRNFWNVFDQFLEMRNMRKSDSYVVGENRKLKKMQKTQ